MSEKIHEVVIVGSGPAGYTACDGTGSATDFFTDISGGDSGGTTLRAMNTHGDAFVKRGNDRRPLPCHPKRDRHEKVRHK